MENFPSKTYLPSNYSTCSSRRGSVYSAQVETGLKDFDGFQESLVEEKQMGNKALINGGIMMVNMGESWWLIILNNPLNNLK